MAFKIFTTAREMISRRMRLLRRKIRALVGRQSKQKSSPSEIYSLFQQASDLSGKRRDRFLEDLRHENEADYREIVSLLGSPDSPYIFPLPAPPEPMLKPGDTLGRYEILEFIDRGGMSEVYKASHPELGIRALKILIREVAENAALIGRLRLEAKSASAINHRNIVTIHDFDQQGHLHYMVMEFVEGQSLRKMIGNLSVGEAVNYARQMAEALSFAHGKGIIHRDIKPENIMVRTDGSVKILDFGLAKPVLLGSESPAGGSVSFSSLGIKSDPHVLMGTLPYMAPEQLDFKDASAQSDTWSWGVVFYEMLAGRRPFEASTDYEIEAIRKKEPGPPSRYRELNRIVLKALRKKPEERYRAMAEAVPGLESFVIPNWTVRIAALIASLLLVLAIGYWQYWQTVHPLLEPVGQLAPLSQRGLNAAFPALSTDQMRMLYTSECHGESRLSLVEMVDGTPRADWLIARSLQAKIVGAVFAKNDSRTIYFLLQDRVTGVGTLYLLRLSTLGTKTPACNSTSVASSTSSVLRFARDEILCQQHNPDMAFLSWYHREAGSGRFEPLCQTRPQNQKGDSVDSPPSFSPDGKYFVFFSVAGATNEESLVRGSAAGGAETVLMKNDVPPYAYLNPMWSPDGNRILTAKWDLSVGITLWSIKIKDGRREGEPKPEPLGHLPFRGKLAWLNNGDSIAVSASDKGTTQLFQIRMEGSSGRHEMLSVNNDGFGDLDSITCSPELFHNKCQQELIAAKHDDRSHVSVTALNEDHVHEITDEGKYSGITWKDGHTLVSQSEYGGNPALSTFNADGSGELSSVENNKQRVKDVAASPDGRYLIYSSNQSDGIHLWRIDLKDKNAKPLQLTFGNSVEYRPDISSDGHWVIFTSITHGFETLWKMKINETVPHQIGKQTARVGSMAADGRIVCECLLSSGSNWEWRIAILDEDGQLIRDFPDIPRDTGRPHSVKWSPGEKSILYVKEQNGIENVWRKSIQDGGPGTQVTQFGEERIFAFALSPDGNRIACLCGHEEAQIFRMLLRAK